MALMQRKKILTERGFQFRFARFVLFYMTLCCFATAVIVFYATFSVLSEKLVGIYPQHRLPEIFSKAYWAFFAGFAVSVPFLFYISLMFSHRIAGPLPKIYRTLQSIGDGNFDVRLTLRKKDELRDLADHINNMVEKLKERESKK